MVWYEITPRRGIFGFVVRPITQLLPRRGSVVTVTPQPPPPRSFDHETTKTTTAHHRYYTNYYQALYSHFHPVRLIRVNINNNNNNNYKSIGDRAAAAGYRHGYGNTGCACARQRVNRCMTRSHTKVIIVLRVRGGEWRASIARTNERPAEKAAAAAEPLRASPALELYSYVMILLWSSPPPSCLPSSDLLENPTRARRRFLFLFVYFSVRHLLSRRHCCILSQHCHNCCSPLLLLQ